jgi:alpha-tubulin suppressor-like RCC1 family protein
VVGLAKANGPRNTCWVILRRGVPPLLLVFGAGHCQAIIGDRDLEIVGGAGRSAGLGGFGGEGDAGSSPTPAGGTAGVSGTSPGVGGEGGNGESGKGGGGNGGGDGGEAGAVDGPPVLGGPCASTKDVCDGSAQKERLTCRSGSWSRAESCGESENCDQPSGACRPIVPACSARKGGERYCAEESIDECGVDRVSTQLIERCSCYESADRPRCKVDAVTVGWWHACALSEGRVRCWGYGADGELGYGNKASIGVGDTPDAHADVDVGGKVRQIGAGTHHTCALLENGDVRCWGRAHEGQLGRGNTENLGDEPEDIPGLVPPVNLGGKAVQIAVGGDHTCALLESGGVRCWGLGDMGQLGYGNPDNVGDNETPASLDRDVPLGGTATSIAAGYTHTCATLEGGTFRCWGEGVTGQLGYGVIPGTVGENVGAYTTPADEGDVPFMGSVRKLALGVYHTCALLSIGTVRCWGDNSNGELGSGNDGDITSADAARNVKLGGTALDIVAGHTHTCALLDDGNTRCWGSSEFGQLGNGTDGVDIGDDEPPESALPIQVGGKVRAIAASSGATCAVLETGGLRCWGDGGYGRLGYGNEQAIGDDELPVSAGDVPVF